MSDEAKRAEMPTPERKAALDETGRIWNEAVAEAKRADVEEAIRAFEVAVMERAESALRYVRDRDNVNTKAAYDIDCRMVEESRAALRFAVGAPRGERDTVAPEKWAPTGPYNAEFIQPLNQPANWRIADSTDSRIATCYSEANARWLVARLNHAAPETERAREALESMARQMRSAGARQMGPQEIGEAMKEKRKSRWVCRRCGLAVHAWGSTTAPQGYVWKHSAPGQHRTPPGTKHKPEPVQRPGWTPPDETRMQEMLRAGAEDE